MSFHFPTPPSHFPNPNHVNLPIIFNFPPHPRRLISAHSIVNFCILHWDDLYSGPLLQANIYSTVLNVSLLHSQRCCIFDCRCQFKGFVHVGRYNTEPAYRFAQCLELVREKSSKYPALSFPPSTSRNGLYA